MTDGTNIPPSSNGAPPLPGPRQFYVFIENQTYGPYSADQMGQFTREGRVNAASQVQATGSTTWTRAADQPDLAGFFGGGPPGPPRAAPPAWPPSSQPGVIMGGGLAPPPMGFGQAVNIVLKQKYVDFDGRARRAEYWWFLLFTWLVFLAVGLLMGVAAALSGGSGPNALVYVFGALFVVILLGMVLPGLGVTVRRMHDHGWSGWWYLLFLVICAIPLVGFLASIAFIVFMAMRGNVGPNKYGPDPLGGA